MDTITYAGGVELEYDEHGSPFGLYWMKPVAPCSRDGKRVETTINRGDELRVRNVGGK